MADPAGINLKKSSSRPRAPPADGISHFYFYQNNGIQQAKADEKAPSAEHSTG
jgi:hypothetical protein